ncbi:MAG: cytochrome d ubiquinol oxidase subunit II [Ktedonobacteraceae bacterium]
MSIALIALSVLWFGLIAYAVLGGADFGAGIWDILAFGSQAERQHRLVNKAIGPVWEANHVWLIFLIVGLFNVFPTAFAALTTALFIPFTIVLVGIVLRGSAFIFRTYAIDSTGTLSNVWSRVFSITSIITPFFLGASAAAVASGHIQAASGGTQADSGVAWLTPFAIIVGAMAVALCASLAAVYLTVEASNAKDTELADMYRRRALLAGAVTAVFGALALLLSPSEAPILWQGMLTRAIPVVIVTMLIGLATAASLFVKRYRLARALIILEAAFMLGSWGLSQIPYIIPPHVTIDNAANDPNVILILLLCTVIGMLIVLPSLYYLFSVFKLQAPAPGLKKDEPKQPEQRAGDVSSDVAK